MCLLAAHFCYIYLILLVLSKRKLDTQPASAYAKILDEIASIIVEKLLQTHRQLTYSPTNGVDHGILGR